VKAGLSLSSRRCRVDWWPVPVLDAPPVCAALLDLQHGGYFSLAPEELLYEPDGSIAAAATKSLPEAIGGKEELRLLERPGC
jgi:hypothetical protein